MGAVNICCVFTPLLFSSFAMSTSSPFQDIFANMESSEYSIVQAAIAERGQNDDLQWMIRKWSLNQVQ